MRKTMTCGSLCAKSVCTNTLRSFSAILCTFFYFVADTSSCFDFQQHSPACQSHSLLSTLDIWLFLAPFTLCSEQMRQMTQQDLENKGLTRGAYTRLLNELACIPPEANTFPRRLDKDRYKRLPPERRALLNSVQASKMASGHPHP